MLTLRQLRDDRGWTQAELAERVGIHANTLARLERGEHAPSEPVRRLIALTFGVGTDAIAYGPENAAVARRTRDVS